MITALCSTQVKKCLYKEPIISRLFGGRVRKAAECVDFPSRDFISCCGLRVNSVKHWPCVYYWLKHKSACDLKWAAYITLEREMRLQVQTAASFSVKCPLEAFVFSPLWPCGFIKDYKADPYTHINTRSSLLSSFLPFGTYPWLHDLHCLFTVSLSRIKERQLKDAVYFRVLKICTVVRGVLTSLSES